MLRSERKKYPKLTAEAARELLAYDPETGLFTWRISGGNFRSGGTAGSISKTLGYVFIEYQNRPYLAHRLAFLIMTGEWPTKTVDHRDANKSNNKWLNLRDVSQHVNSQNKRSASKQSSSGLLGVHWAKHANSWRACIGVRGKQIKLGYFKDPNAAHAAYVAAKRIHHEGCTL